MPLSDHARIQQHRFTPRIVALWQALVKLRSTVSFMNSGAHPDDETSDMLAALGFRDGVDLSYACATRGEGGQNDIGTENGAALAVLRSAEMERAAERLDMRLYWLSESPDDTITDFGFSKSGEETLQIWGAERTLRRFVEIVRAERPDILCPTFLDVPGQHGHHRAMTQAAHQVMDLAADPAFDTGQPVWEIAKLYLPAWSGAGQSYDDDAPPPPTSVIVPAAGRDPVTGFSFAQIGEQSRAFHRTQAMGKWMPLGCGQDRPLHLAVSRVHTEEASVLSGLAQTLADFGLPEAQAHFDAAIDAFPDLDTVLAETSAGLGLLQTAQIAPEHMHKIRHKIRQAARVIRLAAGVDLHIALDRDVLANGDRAVLQLHLDDNGTETISQLRLPRGWEAAGETLRLDAAQASPDLTTTYDPLDPQKPCLSVRLTRHGIDSETALPLEQPPLVMPDHRVALSPLAEVVNLQSSRRALRIELKALAPITAEPELVPPDGWTATPDATGVTLSLSQATPGSYDLPIRLDEKPAQTVQLIQHDHVPPRALTRPATLKLHVIDCALPDARIGYIGGGNDQVDTWLARAGFDITSLDDEELTSDAALAGYDALVIGIFAMKFRPGLASAMPTIHRWVAAGGTLLTLYHRPWDNWDPETAAPRRIEIGQPSLRWRVTDQNAAVRHLTDHPVLRHPNPIGPEDWSGWQKERGLYFAKDWDEAYTALVEMADPGEAPHRGALLTTEFGAGRHSHCALILHHQLAQGVPGAYRLMANLLAPRR